MPHRLLAKLEDRIKYPKDSGYPLQMAGIMVCQDESAV